MAVFEYTLPCCLSASEDFFLSVVNSWPLLFLFCFPSKHKVGSILVLRSVLLFSLAFSLYMYKGIGCFCFGVWWLCFKGQLVCLLLIGHCSQFVVSLARFNCVARAVLCQAGLQLNIFRKGSVFQESIISVGEGRGAKPIIWEAAVSLQGKASASGEIRASGRGMAC